MTDSTEGREQPREHLKAIAREILEVFSKVVEEARKYLADPPSSTSGPVLTINRGVREMYRHLAREPAIARVVVIDCETDEKKTYFICRGAPPTNPIIIDGDRKPLASYRSPVGRLAALPVSKRGVEETIRIGGKEVYFEILETARLHPEEAEKGVWDSKNSILAGKPPASPAPYGPLTVKSLRDLLSPPVEEPDDVDISRLLDEEYEAEIIQKGIRRSVITKAELRDQPILDQYQDKVFRLPLGSRLLILGAPGTGKTTTLIRRLSQKIDMDFLEEDERRAVTAGGAEAVSDHARSWIMFTPTELLQLYVKEAFNREDIPAPDERIKTWDEFRIDLARSKFMILRSTFSRSSYVMKESARTLVDEINMIDWFDDFNAWQKSAFLEDLRVSATTLSENSEPEAAQIGTRLLAALGSADAMPGAFVTLTAMADEIREYAKSLKGSSDEKIRGALNLQVNRDRGFLDSLADFMKDLPELNDDLEDQEEEEENENESNPPRIGHDDARRRYMQTVRTQARARARKRSVSKSSQSGRLIEWLGVRSLSEQNMKDVGESLLLQSALRRFVRPVQNYIDGTPRRYRRYRRIRQTEKRWYQPGGFDPADIHPLEVDVLLLAMMRNTDDLIKNARSLVSDEGAWETLERLQYLRLTQILVDEATDFSPIQLSCMALLARPETQSFFACGDFNQRVTNWGTRSEEQMKWAVPGINIQVVSVAYRQSRQLHDLAGKIVRLAGDSPDRIALPEHVENEGVRPVLALRMTGKSEIAAWLADRIQEIEDRQNLPSIAVLVNSEEEIHPLEKVLGEALAEQNIKVIACPGGRVLGRGSAVRIFSVQHIKGLEFEAVFFIGVDNLAKMFPGLFHKYLYVGATRAATYLGITCEEDLPAEIAELEDLFGGDWR